MNIKFSQLELARSNPKKFSTLLKATDKFGGGTPKFRNWQFAVRVYHKKDSRIEALNHMDRAFDRYAINSRNLKQKDEYFNKLESYILDYESNMFKFIEIGKRVTVIFSEENYLSGEGPRVDKIKNGHYSLCLFVNTDEEWRNELKYPLLQHHYAKNVFKCEYDNVQVGVYNINNDSYDFEKFSSEKIKESTYEMANLFKSIQ